MGDEAEYLDDAGDYYAWRDQQDRERAEKASKPRGAKTYKTKGAIPMSENTTIAVNDNSYSILPRNLEAQITDAVNMRNALNKLFENVMEINVDFGRIPGTDKPTLLKPGAELLCKIFKLAQGKADVLDKGEDWENGIFTYTVGMPLIHIDSGLQVAYGIGAANSHETKHRYRNQKDESGNVVGKIENPDPADLQNTLIKMANKRAFVDAVLKATNASRYFTQDMEDFGAMTGQFEKASSKQINYIKQLFRDDTDDDAMEEIAKITGREVKGFDDIYRTEASRIIDAKKGSGGGNGGSYNRGQSAPPAQAAADDAILACADCGVTITKAEHGYSNNKFGRPLCREHQNAERNSGA